MAAPSLDRVLAVLTAGEEYRCHAVVRADVAPAGEHELVLLVSSRRLRLLDPDSLAPRASVDMPGELAAVRFEPELRCSARDAGAAGRVRLAWLPGRSQLAESAGGARQRARSVLRMRSSGNLQSSPAAGDSGRVHALRVTSFASRDSPEETLDLGIAVDAIAREALSARAPAPHVLQLRTFVKTSPYKPALELLLLSAAAEDAAPAAAAAAAGMLPELLLQRLSGKRKWRVRLADVAAVGLFKVSPFALVLVMGAAGADAKPHFLLAPSAEDVATLVRELQRLQRRGLAVEPDASARLSKRDFARYSKLAGLVKASIDW